MEENRSNRFVKLHIRVTQNPIWTQLSPAVFKVFVAFVMKANYQDATWYDGSTEHPIPRGSFLTSYSKMAQFCNLSLQQVRDAFSHLDFLRIATYSRACGSTLVTVVNYEIYQIKKGNTEESSNKERNTAKNSTGNIAWNTPSNLISASVADICIESEKPRNIVRNTGETTTNNIVGTQRAKKNTERNIARTPDIESVEVIEKNSLGSPLEQAVERVADRLHERHPAVRRCSPNEIRDKLRSIVKPIHGVPAKIAKLEAIDLIHGGWCRHPDWTKEGGKYAKGLGNWLAPTMNRYDIPAPATQEDDEMAVYEENNRIFEERQKQRRRGGTG